ncbi:pre-16S rRNA-processing nuclease YqgF [Natronospora cellulosivora (SeqCode)]
MNENELNNPKKNRELKKSKDNEKSKSLEENLVLAIDPGRDKCGLAIINQKKDVLYKNIIKTELISSYLKDLNNKHNIDIVILGNGTYSRKISQEVNSHMDCPFRLIDEAYTTIEAERRYREENYRGWCRFFNFIKWKPSRSVDDYVAIILAERFLEE